LIVKIIYTINVRKSPIFAILVKNSFGIYVCNDNHLLICSFVLFRVKYHLNGAYPVNFSSEAKEISEILKRNKINELYHFTNIENLPKIRRMQALCSKAELENSGLWSSVISGGNDLSHNLDRRFGN
jgi:hypothetical protein